MATQKYGNKAPTVTPVKATDGGPVPPEIEKSIEDLIDSLDTPSNIKDYIVEPAKGGSGIDPLPPTPYPTPDAAVTVDSPGAKIAAMQKEDAQKDYYFTDDAIASIQSIITKIENLPGAILAKGKLFGAIERLREGQREQQDGKES